MLATIAVNTSGTTAVRSRDTKADPMVSSVAVSQLGLPSAAAPSDRATRPSTMPSTRPMRTCIPNGMRLRRDKTRPFDMVALRFVLNSGWWRDERGWGGERWGRERGAAGETSAVSSRTQHAGGTQQVDVATLREQHAWHDVLDPSTELLSVIAATHCNACVVLPARARYDAGCGHEVTTRRWCRRDDRRQWRRRCR